MVPERPTSLRRVALRFLPLAFIFMLPNVVTSQSNYCEPSTTVKEDLKEIDKLYDEDLPFNVRRDRQLALFQDALKKHPTDLHVRLRSLDPPVQVENRSGTSATARVDCRGRETHSRSKS